MPIFFNRQEQKRDWKYQVHGTFHFQKNKWLFRFVETQTGASWVIIPFCVYTNRGGLNFN